VGLPRIAPRRVEDWDDNVRDAFDVLNPERHQNGDGPSVSLPNMDDAVRSALGGLNRLTR
jgi:hypothetical protein